MTVRKEIHILNGKIYEISVIEELSLIGYMEWINIFKKPCAIGNPKGKKE